MCRFYEQTSTSVKRCLYNTLNRDKRVGEKYACTCPEAIEESTIVWEIDKI